MLPPRTIGSTWLTQRDGILWPVVLCDDETTPEAFRESRIDPFVFPAILLGKHKYIWVRDDSLQEFEPGTDYLEDASSFGTQDIVNSDSEDQKLENLRCNAFRQDAMLFENATFWKNYIESKSKARKLENEIMGGRKRKQSFAEDDDVEILGIKGTSSTASSSTLQYGSHNRGHRRGKGPLPTPGPSPKKARVESKNLKIDVDINKDGSEEDTLFIRQSNLSDPFVRDTDEDEEDADREGQLERVRESNLQRVRDNPPIYNGAVIFVGEEYATFFASRFAIGKCDFLSVRTQFTDDLRSHINLFEDTEISSEAFAPIADYLRHSEFAPKLIEKDTHQRLEKVLLPEEKDQAAHNIAMIYNTAAKIQFGQVQLLCVNKLRVLHPLSHRTLLIVAMIITRADGWGCKAEEEIQEWLVDHLTDYYYSLMQYEPKNLAKVMKDNEGLSSRVHFKLASDPEGGRQGMDED